MVAAAAITTTGNGARRTARTPPTSTPPGLAHPAKPCPLGGGCGGGHQGDQEDGCGGGQLLLIPHYIELALLWIALSRGLVLVK